MNLKWFLLPCLAALSESKLQAQEAQSALHEDDECRTGSCAIEALQVHARMSEVAAKCAGYTAAQQFACNADPDCKFCWDASMDKGNCKVMEYSPDADSKENCDVVPTGCNKYGRDNSTCNADDRCKFCESFVGSPDLKYCVDASSQEDTVAECDEIAATQTSNASSAVLGASAAASWYWSHGRWHPGYRPRYRPVRHWSDRRRHQNPVAGSCSRYGCSPFNRAYACQCNQDCVRFNSCCSDFHAKCHRRAEPAAPKGGQVLTLFHQTSPEIGAAIMKEGFRPGRAGWCGGAIYFATSPRATETKAIGTDSHLGYMLTVKVRVGQVAHLNNHCEGHGQARAGGANSVEFNPGDGPEYVIWNKDQVVSISGAPYENHRAVHKWNR